LSRTLVDKYTAVTFSAIDTAFRIAPIKLLPQKMLLKHLSSVEDAWM
jgi:hypothetical protein